MHSQVYGKGISRPPHMNAELQMEHLDDYVGCNFLTPPIHLRAAQLSSVEHI